MGCKEVNEEDKTPIGELKVFKFLRKPHRVSKDWKNLGWIEADFEFDLRSIMLSYPFKEACGIVNSIKRHFLKHR